MRILTPSSAGVLTPSGSSNTNPTDASISGLIVATANFVSPTVDFYAASGGVYEWTGYLNLVSTTVVPAGSALTLWFEYTVGGAVNTQPVTMGDLASAPPNAGFSTLSFLADAGTPFSWWYEVALFTAGTATIEYRMATFQRV